MQNAIWKLSALAGVVGIGFLAVLQVQQGLSLGTKSAEDGQQIASENAEGTAGETHSIGNVPPDQGEPAFGEEDHAGHHHGPDGVEEAGLQHGSGLDFRTDHSGNPLERRTAASPSAPHATTDDPFGAGPTPEKDKPQAATGADRTAAIEDDPFAALDAPSKKATETEKSSDAEKPKQDSEVKPTSHEADAAGDEAENVSPAAEVDESKDPAGGAGPQLFPAPDDEPRQLNESKESGASSPLDNFDPFSSPDDSSKRDDAKASSGKPRVLPQDEEQTKPGESTKEAAGKEEKNSRRNAFVEDDPFAAEKRANAPRASLSGSPSPNPSAFDPVPENGAQSADDGDTHEAPKSQLGSQSTSVSDQGPALSGNAPSLAVPEDQDSHSESDQPESASRSNDAGPVFGGNEPTRNAGSGQTEPEKSGPARDVPSLEDTAPNRLAAPEDATPLGGSPEADFQGDGTIDGDVQFGPQRPQLTIEKVAPPNAVLGQPLIYSILVKNVGTTPANDVVVEDRIPKGSKLSGTIPRAELADKTLIWKLGNLAPGEQRKISIRVVPLEAGQIGSVATVNFVAEVAAETQITAPQLRIDLAGPREAKLGDPVPFHFRVTNTGTGEASGVVIRDLIPEGLKHAAGNDLEYEIGRLPAGESREIKLALTAAKIGPAVNHAVVTATGGVKSEAKVSVDIYGTKLVLKRTGPTRRYLGRTTIYTNTVTNESSRPVETATVTEVVPEGFDFAEASDGGQYHPGSRTIAWQVNRLGPGESRELKVKLVPKSTGTLTSVVKAAAAGGEPAEVTMQTVVEGFAAIRLEIPSIETPVDVGEKTNVRVVARNQGNSPATNVELLLDIPPQFKVVTARGPSKYEQVGNQLRFSPIPSMDGRTSAAFDVELEAVDKGDARLRVQIGGDYLDRPLVREESILVLSEGQ